MSSQSSALLARPKGSTTPRLSTPPLACHSEPLDVGGERCGCGCSLTPQTSWGFECVQFLTLILGWSLIPWQRWLYIHALEKNEAGTGLRFKTIIILIARQNGKTQWLKGIGLWKLFLDGAKQVLISAQNLEIAETTLAEAVADVKACRLTRKEYRGFSQTNGKFKLRLAPTKDAPEEPRAWRAAVAGVKGGRSLSIDLAIMDELRLQQTWKAWDAIAPTTLARPRSLVVGASNAGDATSTVLASLRNGAIKKIAARSTESTRTGFFEWSAPEGVDPFAEEFWPAANPSLGHMFEIEDLRAYLEAKEDDLAGWQTEYLCQWVLSLTPSVFPEADWLAGLDGEVKRAEGSPVWCSVDLNEDRSKAYIGVAASADRGESTRPDDIFAEVIAALRGPAEVIRWFEDPEHPDRLTRFAGIVVQKSGAPASGMIEALRKAGGEWIDPVTEQPCNPTAPGAVQLDGPLNVVELGGPDLTKAYGDCHDMITDRRFWHRPAPALDAAAAGAQGKWLGDAWAVDRKRSPVDVSPIISVVQASWGLAKAVEPERTSAYENGGLTVV